MGRKVNRRKSRNYFINKDIQKRVIGINLIYMFLVMLLTMAVMVSRSVDDLFSTHDIVNLIAPDMHISLSAKLYFIVVATFLLAVINQLWLTHQFCGSLVNFTNIFNIISKGDLSRRIALRRADLLKKEAGQFNEMIDELSLLIAALKKDNSLLLSTLKELINDSVEPGKIEEARKIVNQQEQYFTEHLSKLKLLRE